MGHALCSPFWCSDSNLWMGPCLGSQADPTSCGAPNLSETLKPVFKRWVCVQLERNQPLHHHSGEASLHSPPSRDFRETLSQRSLGWDRHGVTRCPSSGQEGTPRGQHIFATDCEAFVESCPNQAGVWLFWASRSSTISRLGAHLTGKRVPEATEASLDDIVGTLLLQSQSPPWRPSHPDGKFGPGLHPSACGNHLWQGACNSKAPRD